MDKRPPLPPQENVVGLSSDGVELDQYPAAGVYSHRIDSSTLDCPR